VVASLATGVTPRERIENHVEVWAPAGFFPGVSKLRVWGQKSPSGVQEWSPAGGLEATSPEADDIL